MKKNSREAGLKKKKNSRKLIKLIGMNYLSIFGSYCTMDYHILTNNLNIALQLKNSMWDMRVMMTSARRWRVTAKWMNLQWSEKNLSIQIDFFFWKLWWIENIKLVTLWLYKINSAFFRKCHLQYKIDAKLQRCLQVIFLGNQEPILKDN